DPFVGHSQAQAGSRENVVHRGDTGRAGGRGGGLAPCRDAAHKPLFENALERWSGDHGKAQFCFDLFLLGYGSLALCQVRQWDFVWYSASAVEAAIWAAVEAVNPSRASPAPGGSPV